MSKLYVNEIKPKTSGGVVTGASNVLEMIPMVCDGENYTSVSGTYTPTNVTAVQNLTSTYVDVNGSSISYTPPEGTTTVMYDFALFFGLVDSHCIAHFRFYIDGTEITNARKNIGISQNPELPIILRYIIPIGGTANASTGRQASWTSAKTLKIQAREYGSSNEAKLHATNYWDGASTAQFSQPNLTITSIGSPYNG